MQRNIGHGCDQHDQRHDRRDGLALAVARGNEIRDRMDVCLTAHARDALQQGIAESEQQHGPEQNRQVIPALRGGGAHEAVEGPGCAIDADREGIDQRVPRPAGRAEAPAVADARDPEQQREVGD